MSTPAVAASIDAGIDDFTRQAERGEFYTGAGTDAPPPAAGPGGPAASPVTLDEWQPNPQRIERLKGPAGTAWGMTWNKVAEKNGVPDLQVGAEQRETAGQSLAELLDAILPQEIVGGPKSRGETVLYALVGLGFVGMGNIGEIQQAKIDKAAAAAGDGGNGGT